MGRAQARDGGAWMVTGGGARSKRQTSRRCRHVVAAHRLRVPADVQRERAFSSGQHLVRFGRAGPELFLGPRVAIYEHSVPRLDVLVDRLHAGVVVSLEPTLC